MTYISRFCYPASKLFSSSYACQSLVDGRTSKERKDIEKCCPAKKTKSRSFALIEQLHTHALLNPDSAKDGLVYNEVT